MYPLQICLVCQNKSATIYSEKVITVCNAVFFRLCIDLMHILPPVTAEGFDGSHYPRFAEWDLMCLKAGCDIVMDPRDPVCPINDEILRFTFFLDTQKN